MADDHAPKLKRYLPHVLVATLAVAVLPLALVSMLQVSGHLRSPWASVALAMVLSIGFATAGSAYWTRRSGSRDLVFGDLMIWGWIRRVRTERRLAKATRLLGYGSLSPRDTQLDAKRRAELLQELASALEARDPYTHGHSRRVARHSHMIAKAMGLSREQLVKVDVAATVHDVGKINTPRATLNKPGKLTDGEFAVMKRHPADGAEMVADMKDPEISAMVRHHHERLDGAGYPEGLSGAEIPQGARIIAVADTFDAITSSRPYRPAAQHRKAIETLKGEAGFQLDPEAVGAFLSYYTGRRSVAYWTLVSAVPERLLGWLGGAFRSVGAAPIAKSASLLGASVVMGGSLATFGALGERHPSGRVSGPVAEAAVGVAGGAGIGASLRDGGQTGGRPQAGSASRHGPASGRGSKPGARGSRRSDVGASRPESSGFRPSGAVAPSVVLSRAPSSTRPVGAESPGDGRSNETLGGDPGHEKTTGTGHEKKRSGPGHHKKKEQKHGAGDEQKKNGAGHAKAGSPGKSGSPARGRSAPASASALRTQAPSSRSFDSASETGGLGLSARSLDFDTSPGGSSSDFASVTGDSDFATGSWEPGTGDFDTATGSWDPGTAESDLAAGFWDPGTGDSDLAAGSWDPGTTDSELAAGSSESELAPGAGDPGLDPVPLGYDFAPDPGAPPPPPE